MENLKRLFALLLLLTELSLRPVSGLVAHSAAHAPAPDASILHF